MSRKRRQSVRVVFRLPSLCVFLTAVAYVNPAAGSAGYSLTFDGSSTYVEVASDCERNPWASKQCSSPTALGQLSIMCWAFPAGDLSATDMALVDKGGIIGVQEYNLALGNNLVKAKLGNGTGSWQTEMSIGASTTQNTWIHVALTWDGFTLLLYVGGVLLGSTSHSGALVSSAQSLLLGAQRSSAGVVEAFLDGRLDDVYVFGNAPHLKLLLLLLLLLCEDVMMLASSSLLLFRASAGSAIDGNAVRFIMNHGLQQPFSPHLVGYWPFNEGEGVDALDHSSNGNNGIVQGSASWAASTAPVGTEVTVNEDEQVLIALNGSSSLSDADLMATITALPAQGSLYQALDDWTRGPVIASVPSAVTGPGRRVVFVPAASTSGIGYAFIGFSVSDYQGTSPGANVTINVQSVPDGPTIVFAQGFNTSLLSFRCGFLHGRCSCVGVYFSPVLKQFACFFPLPLCVFLSSLTDLGITSETVTVDVNVTNGNVAIPTRSLSSNLLSFTDTVANANAALQNMVYERKPFFGGKTIITVTATSAGVASYGGTLRTERVSALWLLIVCLLWFVSVCFCICCLLDSVIVMKLLHSPYILTQYPCFLCIVCRLWSLRWELGATLSCTQ